MAKIAVINESAPTYNLACHKMSNKFRLEGHEVFQSSRSDFWALECDSAYLSAIFTWSLPSLIEDTNLLKAAGLHVEVGGPAVTAMSEYVRSQTGVVPHLGLDDRFEFVPGDDYKMVFTSRGCSRGCEFCLVKDIEGRRMIQYDDFPVPAGENPYIGDNNLILTSWEHQLRVIDRMRDVRNLDINSGFDDRVFAHNPDRYWDAYRQLHLECWRFAYDKPEQKDPIEHCARFLAGKGVDYRHIIVYCLVGPGMTFQEAVDKLLFLQKIGTSPYPMRFRPFDTTDSRNYVPDGWEPDDMDRLFAYFGNPFVWRSDSWEHFDWKGYKKRKPETQQSLYSSTNTQVQEVTN